MSYRRSRRRNKLHLFYPVSLFGLIITIFTKSPFAHAAIEVDGVLYDSSESRGKFGVSHIKPGTRKSVVIEFDGDLSAWLFAMDGKEYDWKGVFLWLIGSHDKDKFYCFETVWLGLEAAGVVHGEMPESISGSDLLRIMAEHLSKVDPMVEVALARSLLFAIGGDRSVRYLEDLSLLDKLSLARKVINSTERALLTAIQSLPPANDLDRDEVLMIEQQLLRDKVSIRA